MGTQRQKTDDPLALCDCAEDIMRGLVEWSGKHPGKPYPYPPTLRGQNSVAVPNSCPDLWLAWSPSDIQQGTDFIVRMGFMELERG